MSGMEGNKKPMQQKAVLQWILSVVEDFGLPNLNTKAIVSYLQKPTALQSSSPDVKKAAVAVLGEMFHQVVDVCTSIVAGKSDSLARGSFRSSEHSAEEDPRRLVRGCVAFWLSFLSADSIPRWPAATKPRLPSRLARSHKKRPLKRPPFPRVQ